MCALAFEYSSDAAMRYEGCYIPATSYADRMQPWNFCFESPWVGLLDVFVCIDIRTRTAGDTSSENDSLCGSGEGKKQQQ